MGFFKCLLYVAGGVGAVVLAPVTGGSSIALAIGAMGTTTAAGAAIGAGVGAAAAAIDHHAHEVVEDAYKRGQEEGTKAGEQNASKKYEEKMAKLINRLKNYHDFDEKLVGMYAVGLAIANSDGFISEEELDDLNAFVIGASASNLPFEIKESIGKLKNKPPTLEKAIEFARKAKLSKQDINDIIDLIANADGYVSSEEKQFISRWESISQQYSFA